MSANECYYYDADTYCQQCLPVSANNSAVGTSQQGGDETDFPSHCCVCHRPLDYQLTTQGITYVLDEIKEAIQDGEWEVMRLGEGYYKGLRCIDVVRDWAENLRWYNLSVEDKELVDHFLEITKQ